MVETQVYRKYLRLIVSIILVALMTSVPWGYFYKQQQQGYTVINDSNSIQIQILRQQLAQQSELQKHLLENLSKSQEARIEAETRLVEITKKFSDTEEKIHALEEMDWDSKYELAMIDNEALIEKIAELEFQHAEYIDSLLDERTYIKERHNADIQYLALENQSLHDALDTLEQETFNQQQLITKLQLENTKQKETIAKKNEKKIPIAVESENPTPVEAKQKTPELITGGKYRSARIQSLSTAMVNRNSSERKNILINVIPNIPEGITGNELLKLVQNMDSEDILSVIKSTRTYINRPIKRQTLERLAEDMNNQDAKIASNLLSE